MAVPGGPDSSLPPSPKSPPPFPDLYGKRRQVARVQLLEREIALLEEELKSLDGLQLASSCCKELFEFTERREDPFLQINQQTSTSHCCWRNIWRIFNFKKICCFCGLSSCCSSTTSCCGCCSSSSSSSRRPSRSCCSEKSGEERCNCQRLSCLCCGLWSCFSKCRKARLCPNCTKACCRCLCCR